MIYKFKISKNVDSRIWNQNLLKSNYATFFQTVEYLNFDLPNKFPLFIYVFNDNKQVCGQLALIITKSQRAYSSTKLKQLVKIVSKLGNRGTWVSGPIIHTDNKKARLEILKIFFKALEEISEKYNLMILDGYSPPHDILVDEKYVKAFSSDNFQIENLETFVVNLDQNMDELWKNVEKKARNDVTRAKRREISVREVNNKDDLKQFKILAKTWAKTKGIVIDDPLETFERDWRDYKIGIQKFFLAYQNNEPISGLRVGCFNGIAYTHQVLNSYSKQTSLGGPLLTWSALEWAKNNGMRIYDFSGVKSNPKDENEWNGLREYKKKWGGTVIPYYHFIKTKKKISYKLFRLLSKPDFFYRNYKKKRYQRPKK